MARKKNEEAVSMDSASSKKSKRSNGGSASSHPAEEPEEKKTGRRKKREDTPEEAAVRAEIHEMQQQRKQDKMIKDIVWGLIITAIGAFIFIAIQFHAAGEFGNALGDILRGLFGLIGLVFPWYLVAFGILLITHKASHVSSRTIGAHLLLLLMLCLLNASRFLRSEDLAFSIGDFYRGGVELTGGGVLGMALGMLMKKLIGLPGLYIFSLVAVAICILLLFNTPLTDLVENFRNRREEKKMMKEREFVDSSFDSDLEWERKQKTIPLDQMINVKNNSIFRKLSDDTLSEDVVEDLKIDAPHQEEAKSPSQSNVVDFMNSEEDPFRGKRGADGSRGLEASEGPGRGYGLDGDIPVSGYGLEPTLEREDGQGLESSLGKEDSYGLEPSQSIEFGFGLEDGENRVSDDLGPVTKETVNENSQGEAFPSLSGIEDLDSGASTSSSDLPPLDTSKYEKSKVSSKDIAKGAAEIGADLGLANGAAALTKSVDNAAVQKYHKPSIDLLDLPKNPNAAGINDDLKKKARLLESTLQSFNVDAKVIQVTQGPAVTRYEIQPNVGVKVSKISSLSDDIALNLRAKSIRIEAPIPGKAAVGIEVENDKINMVTIREIIDSKEFRSAASKIEFAVGKDIAGKPIVADLKTMPHLLIAGSTGSGKSVCINSIITSILYKADPDEVKLVLIDPKVVELGNYNGIPHLLIPVVTDPSKAAAALNWAVVEMTNRYKLFADHNVRDLASFNRKMKEDQQEDMIMPQVVIIIDELADLMMAAPSQVEESICRLAQMARAAGMHLIVATQRPSVDIITGVIKANIPSRIAFAVSSQFDSRTILDMSGAEKLVGKGDMLFNPLGMGKPVRVQGTFISDEEVERVIDHVKGQVEEADYASEVMDTIEKGGGVSLAGNDADELLPDAIECVVAQGQASVSMLQRRFRIGYNRAARIMDGLEERGIVGPADGSRPRQVLMTEDELAQLKEETQGM